MTFIPSQKVMERDLFTIERATNKDVQLILTLIRELANEESLSGLVTVDEGKLLTSLFGERTHAEVIIGYHNCEPVSYALFFPSFSSFSGQWGLHLDDLYVRPNVRGQGIGSGMLKYVAKLAQEREFPWIEWHTPKMNESAARFYRRFGALSTTEFLLFRLGGDALSRS